MVKQFYINYKNTPFLQTSETNPHLNRLNWRCEILLTRNQEAIRGKKILDMASHDGRFSYACLKLGASHVTGVEGRHHLVEFATENLTGLGCKPEHFSFIQDDVFDYLPKVKPKEFDTILCFGFFYHTLRQIELLREIKRVQPTYFILDTNIQKGIFIHSFSLLDLKRVKFRHLIRRPTALKGLDRAVRPKKGVLVFRYESHDVSEGVTIDPIDLVAWPTKSTIGLLFKSHGFSFRQLYWNKKEIEDWTAIEEYKAGRRVSYIAQPLEY